MIRLDVDSMDVPERFRGTICREPKSMVITQIYAKIAVATFDTNRLNCSNQEYESKLVQIWSKEQALAARKRDNKTSLCHRHRHMHYPFTQELESAPKATKRRNYYNDFVKSCEPIAIGMEEDSDEGQEKNGLANIELVNAQAPMEQFISEQQLQEGAKMQSIDILKALIADSPSKTSINNATKMA